MKKEEKVLIVLGSLIYSSFAIFSYAYIDLNLTLNRNPLVLSFSSFMQRLGYFNRGLSTVIYLILIILTFGYFIFNLQLISKGKLTIRYLFLTITLLTLISMLAYPFLSSDLFNYIFDAKIVVKYHLSPYTHRALDFPQDDWIRFMRWVHRYSPYGPLWLTMSLLPSIVGFGKFILNLFFFKIFIASFHLINTYIIYKILKKLEPSKLLLGTAFYGLNPVFIIEGVINAHNDVVLATFLLLPVYFYIKRQQVLSFSVIILGFFIKYLPILNLPIFIIGFSNKFKNTKSLITSNLIILSIFTVIYSTFKISVPFVSAGSTQVQFQPWYLFWTVPFISLLAKKEYFMLAIAVSIGASLRYLPFLYNGDWTHFGTIAFMETVTILPAIVLSIYILIKNFIKSR